MSFATKKMLTISALALGMVAVTMSSFKKDENVISRRNLRVIPRNVSDEELIKTMKDISKSLGVNCSYCHVQTNEKANAEYRPHHDFASDDKKEKEIARKMMRMTKDINERLDDMGDGRMTSVSCNTCHRGSTDPASSISAPQPQSVR